MLSLPNQCLFLSLGVALCLGGCSRGPKEIGVSGKVTVEGVPVDSGSIAFVPGDGNTHISGGVIENGSYNVKVPPGKKIVQIRGLKRASSREVYDEVSGKKYTTDNFVRMTPPEYEAAASPLTATIEKEGEVLDFDLKKDFPKK